MAIFSYRPVVTNIGLQKINEAIEIDDYMYSELMERKVDTYVEEGYDSSRIMMDDLMEAIWSIEPQAEIDVMDSNHLVAKYSWGNN